MAFVTLKNNPIALSVSGKILFRSSAYALAAYYYSLILEKFLMISGAAIYSYTTILDYKGVEVLVDPKAWNQESVLMVYLVPYLIQAILVILIYINLKNLQTVPGNMMIFIHWVILFVTFRLTAMLPIHLFFKTGIYHAFSWFYLGTATKAIISIIGLIIFVITTKWMLRGILFFSATLNDNYRVTGLSKVIRTSLLEPVMIILTIATLYYLPAPPKDEITGLLVITCISVYFILGLLFGKHEQLPRGGIITEKSDPILLLPIILVFIIILRILLGIGMTI